VSDRARKLHRADARDSTRRDVARFRQRDTGESFHRSLALIGSAGWPIVLLATGGALLGHHLDARMGTGIRLTLILLTLGTTLGCTAAYRTLKGDDS
jgi:hypothetical protein